MRIFFRAYFLLIICLSFIEARPVFASQIGQADNDGISFVRVLASLLFCLFLAFGIIFVMNKVRLGNSKKIMFAEMFRVKKSTATNIEIVEKYRVNHTSDLVLIQYNEYQYLIAFSNETINLIDKNQLIKDNSSQEVEDLK